MAANPARARAWTSQSRLRARVLMLSGLLWLAGPVSAEPALQSVKGRCEIRFSGSSTLHGFSGEVNSRPFVLETHVDTPDGRAWWSGSVEVAITEMDTGIERRDRNMRAMFDADRFPLIVADFPNVESTALASARSGGEPSLDFDLTIRDAKRSVAAKLSHWTEAGRLASFDLEFELSLEAFGLAVPPVLGLLRVGDTVTVRAHVTLDELPGQLRQPAARERLPGSPAAGS